MNRLISFFKKNYKPLLISFFLALLLWIAVVTNKQYMRKIEVPFRVSRVAPGFVISEPLPDKVVLEVSGRGRALFGLQFYSPSFELELPELKKSSVIQLNDYKSRFDIPRNLGIKLIEIMEPRTVSIKIDRLTEEEKPISINAEIKPLPGYVLNNISPEQNTVMVRGPLTLVRSIKTVQSDSIVKKKLKYPFSAILNLQNPAPDIVSINPDKIQVKFEISQLVERTLYNIPIQLTGIPTNFTAKAIPPNATIRVKGSETNVTVFNAEQATALFNYKTSYESGKTLYEIKVELPPEIKLIDISPKTFRLQLTRKENTD